MTPRERVEAVLRGEPTDKVPFTAYDALVPRCTTERQAREMGLCLVRKCPTFHTRFREVKLEEHRYTENGAAYVKYTYKTPVGDLTLVQKRAPTENTVWTVKHIFTNEKDYDALECLYHDRYSEPYPDAFSKLEEELGQDWIVRGRGGQIPLHEIQRAMGVETFCYEWADNRERILRLHEILVEKARERFPLAAASPALHVDFGGNINPEITSPEMFAKYYLPYINEFSEAVQAQGKLSSCHLDDKNRNFAPLIAKSKLNIVEAFTPPPDCDLSVREALDLWPGKILWLNFPSSVHLYGAETVERTTLDLLHEAAPDNRVIMGITEDMPPDKYQENLLAIARGINRYQKNYREPDS